MIHYDPTISLGTLINLLALVVTVLALYAKVIAKITSLETKVDALWMAYVQRRGIE